ncbi:MAG TPA: MoaD/ThiS family protein [Planctomycetota bacterium]|nr:MoaD/ThiS family protein [Planctomycetota bacterium]
MAASAQVTVTVGSVLLEYTGGRARLSAAGATVGEALDALDRAHAGFKWRVVDEQGRLRPHMALFVNGAPVRDLKRPLRDGDDVRLLQALSGG